MKSRNLARFYSSRQRQRNITIPSPWTPSAQEKLQGSDTEKTAICGGDVPRLRWSFDPDWPHGSELTSYIVTSSSLSLHLVRVISGPEAWHHSGCFEISSPRGLMNGDWTAFSSFPGKAKLICRVTQSPANLEHFCANVQVSFIAI